MVETVVAELGGLHIAVNNAGINKNSAAEDTTEQDWDLTFDLNTKGVFLCCQVSQCKHSVHPLLQCSQRWPSSIVAGAPVMLDTFQLLTNFGC